ncbi:MAG: hypothetical protein ABI026_05485, partial [Gemmatimonadaceae bacterium]
MTDHEVNRRDFIAGTGKLALGAMVAPRMVAAATVTSRAPADRLNVAIVGFGGQGSVNAEALAETCNIVAICDVDVDHMIAKKLADTDGKGTPPRVALDAQLSKAVRYRDFREMLAK